MSTLEALVHLTQLFKETGHAHHQAFLATNGADENWPSWYAAYLQGSLNVLFGVMIQKDELREMLVEFDKRHRMDTSHTEWAEYYAKLFLEHYGLLRV
jgi:sugar/nucleoside kinase (ribokinase family)